MFFAIPAVSDAVLRFPQLVENGFLRYAEGRCRSVLFSKRGDYIAMGGKMILLD
jgi:hypothetical protein